MLDPTTQKQIQVLLHPFIFVMQEGDGIKEDFLDYKLQMLFLRPGNILRSPKLATKKGGDKAPGRVAAAFCPSAAPHPSTFGDSDYSEHLELPPLLST